MAIDSMFDALRLMCLALLQDVGGVELVEVIVVGVAVEAE